VVQLEEILATDYGMHQQTCRGKDQCSDNVVLVESTVIDALTMHHTVIEEVLRDDQQQENRRHIDNFPVSAAECLQFAEYASQSH
jgi:hypothetical protein